MPIDPALIEKIISATSPIVILRAEREAALAAYDEKIKVAIQVASSKLEQLGLSPSEQQIALPMPRKSGEEAAPKAATGAFAPNPSSVSQRVLALIQEHGVMDAARLSTAIFRDTSDEHLKAVRGTLSTHYRNKRLVRYERGLYGLPPKEAAAK